MKQKLIKYILFSNVGLIIIGMLILIPILMIYCAFGGEISDNGYIEGNIEYADEYLSILNNNITKNNNGYVPLSRIIYFYNSDPDLSFKELYENNLDDELKLVKPISDVCIEFYINLEACLDENINNSKQYDEYEIKPFSPPIDFSEATITSFFGNERIVFEEYDIHYAWDFAAKAKTDVYSIGDGIVKKVRFNQTKNETDKNNGLGNYIEIDYEYEGKIYTVIYSHLYPKSTNLKEGEIVYKNQKIAEVGTTGYSTGNHLHFQVSLDGNKIDGLNLIDFSSNL